MAKHKKKKTTHRRRRVSGIGSKSMLPLVGGAVLGYFLGPKINDSLTTKFPTIDPKLIAAGEVLLGIFGPKMVMKNSMPMKVLGGVMLGAGAHLGAKSFGLVSGVPLLAGYKDLRVLAGVKDVPRLNGANSSGASRSQMHVINGIDNAYSSSSQYSY